MITALNHASSTMFDEWDIAPQLNPLNRKTKKNNNPPIGGVNNPKTKKEYPEGEYIKKERTK